MESDRSGFRLFILVFHFLAFGTLFGDILYQRYNIFTPGSQTYAGRFKFLTHINEVLQCLYFLVSFLADVILLLKKPTKPNNNEEISTDCLTDSGFELKDKLFAVAVFPIGVFVAVMFWSIYAIDRELIYPLILDTIFPKLCNHIMHTAVLIFMLVEVFLIHHQYPRDRTSLVAIFFFVILYFVWMLWQKQVLSRWPYPFLEPFTAVHHVAFILTCLVFLYVFYYLGKYCTSLREKLLTSNEKLKKKAK